MKIINCFLFPLMMLLVSSCMDINYTPMNQHPFGFNPLNIKAPYSMRCPEAPLSKLLEIRAELVQSGSYNTCALMEKLMVNSLNKSYKVDLKRGHCTVNNLSSYLSDEKYKYLRLFYYLQAYKYIYTTMYARPKGKDAGISLSASQHRDAAHLTAQIVEKHLPKLHSAIYKSPSSSGSKAKNALAELYRELESSCGGSPQIMKIYIDMLKYGNEVIMYQNDLPGLYAIYLQSSSQGVPNPMDWNQFYARNIKLTGVVE